ncbi:MAG: outer membrane beta-barrel protein [Gammaproteobacteria bacterium]|nr:outer membrane beta-barrel protein [Gammaproteobacteria bacterium]
MRKLALVTAIVAAAAVPAAALADVSYTYVGAGYGALKPDGISRLDGFTLDGSVAVNENVHLIANYLRAKDSPFTANRTRVGAGYNVPLNSQFDVVGRLGWSFTKVSVSGAGSAKDDGVFGQVGVRGMATETLEVNGFLTYDDTEDKVSADLGAVLHFTPQFGATAGYTYSSNLQTWNVGLRYNF